MLPSHGEVAAVDASPEGQEEGDEVKADTTCDATESKEKGPLELVRRRPLDEVPLTHTYTSEQGILYVFDNVDADWKASDDYEMLLLEEGEKQASLEAAHGNGGKDAEADQALQELLAEADAVHLPGNHSLPAFDEPQDPEKVAKRQKRREYRDRKKLKKQAGLFVKANENPNVYVSGLPADVTFQELEALFKRAGVLKVDLQTGNPKIRIYADSDGKGCKGDALVTYAQAASVNLAVKFLHEHEMRPKCRICVQQADFADHERDPRLSCEELRKLATERKQHEGRDRAKYLAAKNAQREAVSWSGEMDDGSGRRIVVMKHMFSVEEAEKEGAEFYTELAEEVCEECEKIGQVVKVTPLERHKQGIVCVKFKSSAEAEECIRVMDGRYFAGRTVEALFYDGKTDLRALGVAPTLPTPSRKPIAAGANGGDPPSRCSGTVVPGEMPLAEPPATDPCTSEGPALPPAEGPKVPADAEGPELPPMMTTELDADQSRPGVAESWGDWLDNQSSDSDGEMRVRVEE